jgi:hypothetical protein
MAYDLKLVDRIRKVVQGERGLLLRIDPTQTVSLVSEPHVRPAEMRGREMDGWLRVDAEVLETDDELRRW